MPNRIYRTFTHHEAVLRICCDQFDAVVAEIVRQRRILEEYIARHPSFQSALAPIDLRADAPEVAAAVGMSGKPPAEVFAEVRARKNKF